MLTLGELSWHAVTAPSCVCREVHRRVPVRDRDPYWLTWTVALGSSSPRGCSCSVVPDSPHGRGARRASHSSSPERLVGAFLREAEFWFASSRCSHLRFIVIGSCHLGVIGRRLPTCRCSAISSRTGLQRLHAVFARFDRQLRVLRHRTLGDAARRVRNRVRQPSPLWRLACSSRTQSP